MEDAKLLRRLRNEEECKGMQKYQNTLYDWKKPWDVKVNAKKVPHVRNGEE